MTPIHIIAFDEYYRSIDYARDEGAGLSVVLIPLSYFEFIMSSVSLSQTGLAMLDMA